MGPFLKSLLVLLHLYAVPRPSVNAPMCSDSCVDGILGKYGYDLDDYTKDWFYWWNDHFNPIFCVWGFQDQCQESRISFPRFDSSGSPLFFYPKIIQYPVMWLKGYHFSNYQKLWFTLDVILWTTVAIVLFKTTKRIFGSFYFFFAYLVT